MKTISFFNIKGGVGKTTSCLAFAQILHDTYHKRVLVVDIDKQGNSTKSLGANPKDFKYTSADLLTNKDVIIQDAVIHTKYGIDVIPASFDLIKANQEVLLDSVRPQQVRFKKQLSPIKDEYDYCIFDFPVDINMAVINALVVTDDVLIPIKVDNYAFEGLENVISTIEDIKMFNNKLSLKGCFITMYVRSKLCESGFNELDNSLGLQFLKTTIHQTVKVGESTFYEPIMSYSPNCRAAKDYRELVAEYLALDK